MLAHSVLAQRNESDLPSLRQGHVRVAPLSSKGEFVTIFRPKGSDMRALEELGQMSVISSRQGGNAMTRADQTKPCFSRRPARACARAQRAVTRTGIRGEGAGGCWECFFLPGQWCCYVHCHQTWCFARRGIHSRIQSCAGRRSFWSPAWGSCQVDRDCHAMALALDDMDGTFPCLPYPGLLI